MLVELPVADEAFLKTKVENGEYRDLGEAMQAAINYWRKNEETLWLKKLQDLLAAGAKQADDGQLIPCEDGFLDDVMTKAMRNSRENKPVRDEIKY